MSLENVSLENGIGVPVMEFGTERAKPTKTNVVANVHDPSGPTPLGIPTMVF